MNLRNPVLSEDGQSIVLRDEDNPNGLAGGGIDINKSDDNVVRNNVIAGASGRAISILDGDNNEVSNNTIGTRGDGTVPDVPEANKCQRGFLYDPANWYGGEGMRILGSDNQILNNRIAGLHMLQSANDTPPMAMELGNAANVLIKGNIIGIDSAGKEVGVCGMGIAARGKTITTSGDSIKIIENTIVRSRKGFEEPESDSAIYLSGSAGITVQGNIVRDATLKVIGFTTTAPSVWKNFEPAKITSLNGTAVSGRSGADSPCPGCVIELFLDDLDEKQEALEMVGTATADANGNWSTTLTKAVPADMALRTTSTTQSVGVIGTLDRGTTTKMSGLQVPPTDLTITGPTEGFIGEPIAFNFQALIPQAMTPMTFTTTATNVANDLVVIESKTSSEATIIWNATGLQTLTVTAENCLGKVTMTHQIEIKARPPETVTLSGATSGRVGVTYEFPVVVGPTNTTMPITIKVEATDHDAETYEATSRSGKASLIWSTPGTKTVKVTASNSGGSATATHTIEISGDSTVAPTAPRSVTISGPTTGTVGQTYNFVAQVGPANTTLPITVRVDGTDIMPNEIEINELTATGTVAWSTPGTKNVIMTVTNAAGSTSATHTIEISASTTPGASKHSVFLPSVMR